MIPQTEVRLLSNVPLNGYEHQLSFDSKTEQATYFMGKTFKTFNEFTYQRDEGSIKVPILYDNLYTCNYVMYQNNGKWFYGFITDKTYINENVSQVHFEIDVWQTWQFDITFNESFVEREHRKRWNSDGSPVINTLDEGLDYGTEYDTVKVQNYVPYGDNYFLVIVCKNRMDGSYTDIEPSVNGSPQPLTYYIHPFKLDGTSPPTTWSGQPHTVDPVMDVLKKLYKLTSAVNNIVSLYITEHVGIDFTYNSGTDNITFPVNTEPVNIQDGTETVSTYRVKSNSLYNKSLFGMGGKYDGYASVSESKLLMYPYTVLVMDDFKGNRLEFKNEYIQSQNLFVTVRGSMGTNNKVAYTIEDYNTSLTGSDLETLSLEHSLINDSPNDVPIITDLLSAYLQGNRNQLANQRNSIVYGSIANSVGSAMGGIGQALARNPIGAVSAMGEVVNSGVSGYFQLQGMIAKKQDIDNTPPQITKMGTNTAFDYGNGYSGVYLIKKQITSEYRKRLTDFFKMYGYKVNELKIPNLKTRQHFNFVRTVGANIVGDISTNDMAKIKSMFDNGVTLWHGDFVQDYSLANGEV